MYFYVAVYYFICYTFAMQIILQTCKSDRADTKILVKLEMSVEQIPLGQKTKWQNLSYFKKQFSDKTTLQGGGPAASLGNEKYTYTLKLKILWF